MNESDIAWGPKKINGNVWERKWKIPSLITRNFFEYWNKNSMELLSQGFSVKKTKGEWYVIQTGEVNTDTIKNSTLPSVKVEPLKDTSGLRPWQVPVVENLCAIIKNQGAAIDGSDLGCGKSYVACAVARELNLNILIVCPKAVRESWNRIINKHFDLKDSLIGIINYEMLRTGKTESKIASYVRRRDTRRKEFIWKLPVKSTLIIWDECQKLKNPKTKNSETCLAALDQGYKMLFCSATVATNPLELYTVGRSLKMFNTKPAYYKWLYEHGVSKGRFGFEFNGSLSVLKKLHKDVFVDRGVRLSRDTIPNFPESQIIAECYNMESETEKKINEVYAEMKLELNRLKSKIKSEKGDSTSELTAILRARQKIELLKIPLFLEMIEDGLENNMSVAVFVNFTETLNAIAERLNTTCIINGEAKNEKNRQQNIDDFQSDKKRVILINIAAGGAGVSLHDITGKHARLSLISPSYSAVLMRQATGRVWRDNAKSKSIQKIVFVSNTVEEKVCESVNKKLINLDMLNDGDLDLI